jgi:anhydro-N-acetylmuramic acid kinase
MSEKKVYRAVGLMSGTSLDGVDAAVLETDGYDVVRPIGFVTLPYDDDFRVRTRACFGREDESAPDIQAIARELTQRHIEAVNAVLKRADLSAADIDVIGFHGQTILHDVERRLTIQIGDAAYLAEEKGIDVVYDLRQNDIQNGGQGAPLLPVYHQARLKQDGASNPCAVLNIGGVANVTYSDPSSDALLAFDTGPGNALMDDMMNARTGRSYDKDGALAASGLADDGVVSSWLEHPYFAAKPPKSLDRNEWDIAAMGEFAATLEGMGDGDAMATLLEFTARSIAASRDHMPTAPQTWYLCGGGRHNKTLLKRLDEILEGQVCDVSALGWDGDATEAEGFAYLAVRSVLNLPITFSSTTGAPKPLLGGVFQKT